MHNNWVIKNKLKLILMAFLTFIFLTTAFYSNKKNLNPKGFLSEKNKENSSLKYSKNDFFNTWSRDQSYILVGNEKENQILYNQNNELILETYEKNEILRIKFISFGGSNLPRGMVTENKDTTESFYIWNEDDFDWDENRVLKTKKEEEAEVGEIIRINQLSFGQDHSGMITQNKGGSETFYAWGKNDKGQLGNNGNEDINDWKEGRILTTGEGGAENISSIKQLSFGNKYSGMITENGVNSESVYTWGDNGSGQLGDGKNGSINDWTQGEILKTGEVGEDSNISSIKQISLGFDHTGMITKNEDGSESVYTWGDNKYGQLGNGNNSQINNWKEGRILTTGLEESKNDSKGGEWIESIKQIEAGKNPYNSGMITNNIDRKESFYVWGDSKGALGDGTSSNSIYWNKRDLANENNNGEKILKFEKIEIGFGSNAGLMAKNLDGSENIYRWGQNEIWDKIVFSTSTEKLIANSFEIYDIGFKDFHFSINYLDFLKLDVEKRISVYANVNFTEEKKIFEGNFNIGRSSKNIKNELSYYKLDFMVEGLELNTNYSNFKVQLDDEEIQSIENEKPITTDYAKAITSNEVLSNKGVKAKLKFNFVSTNYELPNFENELKLYSNGKAIFSGTFDNNIGLKEYSFNLKHNKKYSNIFLVINNGFENSIKIDKKIKTPMSALSIILIILFSIFVLILIFVFIVLFLKLRRRILKNEKISKHLSEWK